MRTTRLLVCLGLVCAATAITIALSSPLDLARATTPELVAMVATAEDLEQAGSDSPAARAYWELMTRPFTAVLSELDELAADSRPRRRLRAAILFSGLTIPFAERTGAEVASARDRLLALCRDADLEVRTLAAREWCCSWRSRLPATVPEHVLASIKDALQSPARNVRNSAGNAAMMLGPLGAPLVPDLLAALGKEPVGGEQGMLAAALPRSRTQDPRIQDALLAQLDDARTDVRAIAVGSLAHLPSANRTTINRLFAVAGNEAEASMVRQQALQSLVSLVHVERDAIALLDLLLAWPNENTEYLPEQRWADLGRVAVSAPMSQASARALAQLRTAMADDPFCVASSAFARVSAARGEAIDPGLVTQLRAEMADLVADSAEGMKQPHWHSVLDAMIDLAHKPGMDVPVDPLRAFLKRVVADGAWYDVEWATAALRRLP